MIRKFIPINGLDVNISRLSKIQPPFRVGVVTSTDSNIAKKLIIDGFKNLESVKKLSLYEYTIGNINSNITHNVVKLSHDCDIIILFEDHPLNINALKPISENVYVFIYDINGKIEIPDRKKLIFGRYCHYRASTSSRLSKLWADSSRFPIYYIPSGTDLNVWFNTGENIEQDVVFFGNKTIETESIKKFLKSSGFNIEFFGKGYSIINPSQARSVLSKTKIVVTTNDPDEFVGTNENLWSYFSCRTMVINKHIKEAYNRFGINPGEHFIEFNHMMELKSKLNMYIKDNNKRNIIKNNAYNFLKENRTWTHSAKNLMEIIVNEYPLSLRDNKFKLKKIERKRSAEEVQIIEGVVSDSDKDKNISFIIPYMHNPERYNMFLHSLNSLKNIIGNKKFEICIHEVGIERGLKELDVKGCNYKFTPYTGVFHRAWVLNSAVKYISTGDYLVLLDGDLIYNNNWMNEILIAEEPCTAWGFLYNMTQRETQQYLSSGIATENRGRMKTPSIMGAAGGATFIPRSIFLEVQGIPEMFDGTWGGEDNAFWKKMKTFGYQFKIFRSKIVHMFHGHRTKRDKNVMSRNRVVFKWNKRKWNEYNQKHTWGVIVDEIPCDFKKENTIDNIAGKIEKITKEIVTKVTYGSYEQCGITIAMLSWMRINVLIRTLEHTLRTIQIPTSICLMVQGSKDVSEEDKRTITNLVNRFKYKYLEFAEYNSGTGVPRQKMIKEALKMNSPYIMTLDDDILFPVGGAELEVSVLKQYSDIGAVNIWIEPSSIVGKVIKSGEYKTITYKRELTDTMTYVDVMGSGCMVVKREVFDKCMLDENYYIGWGDFDFCLQMKQANWNLAMLSVPGVKAQNRGGGGAEYKKVRYNKEITTKSKNYLMNKWKIKV